MTWAALALIILGLTLLVLGFRSEGTAKSVLAFISGMVLTLVGVGWLAALLFGET